jgi:hypothetical protein
MRKRVPKPKAPRRVSVIVLMLARFPAMAVFLFSAFQKEAFI